MYNVLVAGFMSLASLTTAALLISPVSEEREPKHITIIDPIRAQSNTVVGFETYFAHDGCKPPVEKTHDGIMHALEACYLDYLPRA